jgi:hypothetical protein
MELFLAFIGGSWCQWGSGGGQGGFARSAQLFRVPSSNFKILFFLSFYTFPNSYLGIACVGTTVYNNLENFVRKIVVNISENLLNALVAQHFTSGHVKFHVTGSIYLWPLNKCQKYRKKLEKVKFKKYYLNPRLKVSND